MQHSHVLIALYDATPEAEHLADPLHASRARALGSALAQSGIGLVTSLGSPLVSAVVGTHEGHGPATIVLSPAGSRHEHEHAYRLPHGPHMTVYTGRGALGADKTALASAHGLVVLGSNESMLKNILDYAENNTLPIAILTNEDPVRVHERVYGLDQNLVKDLVVTHDPMSLSSELSMRLRRRSFQ